MQKINEEINEFSIESINDYLSVNKILNQGEIVTHISIPGAGNMNLVLRLHISGGRTLIFKKSFDYVKKYPQVPAPINRINVEASFYDLVQNNNSVTNLLPSLLFHDDKNHGIIFEDLGDSKDYSFLYV